MKPARPLPEEIPATIPPLPGWAAPAGAGAGETAEEAAFRAGAALAHLRLAARAEGAAPALWRARLALMAAERCVVLSGRRETAAALRDAVCLMRPGDHPGPAGAVLQQWARAVAAPLAPAPLARALHGVAPERVALCLDAAGGSPVDRAARVLESVLAEAPRAETAALILADAVLSAAAGQDRLVPLLGLMLGGRDLRLRGGDLRRACHRAVTVAAGQAVPLAADLARRAARLRAVVPRLRAKGAGGAVGMFLTQDALAPAALTGLMSDRAARRLCDRLLDLGALRELTGRDSFRLYGV